MQVRLLTNLAPSNAFGQVQMPQEIVLGRLTEFGLPNSVIRRLFFVGASIRVEMRGRICCLFFVGAVVRVEMRGFSGFFLVQKQKVRPKDPVFGIFETNEKFCPRYHSNCAAKSAPLRLA